jgi:hypothetical protein
MVCEKRKRGSQGQGKEIIFTWIQYGESESESVMYSGV